MTAQRPATDALRLEIFRHALTGITDEMSVTLRRAAYSTNIKTRLDFSCALFDGRARSVAQSFAQPIHLGTLAHFVPGILARYGAPLEAGDAILCNDSHLGGLHLNDVCLVAPLIVDGRPFAYAVAMAHHVDVGGGTPGSIGLHREQIQEGLILPPVRIMHDGVVDPGVLAMLVANVRSPRETEGDLRAQLASVGIGLRRVGELIDERGAEAVERGIDDLLDYTRRRSIAAIAALPRGIIEATDYLDDDGVSDEPVKISARITIGEDRVTFDLTGTDLQRPSSINTTKGGALSACAYALRCMIDPDIPVNDGFYQVIELLTTRGSVLDSEGRRRLAAARMPSAGCARPRCARSRGSCPSWLRPTPRARCSTSRSAVATRGPVATSCTTRRRPAAMAGGSGWMAWTASSRTSRTPRTRRSRRPSRTTRSSSCVTP